MAGGRAAPGPAAGAPGARSDSVKGGRFMDQVDHDAIIIGGGHNGLVAAAYLAAAGMDVVLLERRRVLGGACVTEELFPGYRFSACSYICHLLQAKVIEDLELRRHGFEVFPVDPERFQPFADGRRLLVWDDVERTQEEIGRFSRRDARSYPRWLAFWKRAAAIIHPYLLRPPPDLEEMAAGARRTGDEAFLERLLQVSMKEVVCSFFESDPVRGTFVHAHDVGDPAAPGSAWCYAYIKCNLLGRHRDKGIVRGGMGGITRAMARAARARGAVLREGAEVERVLVEDGRAAGVALADGTEIRARVVVSNADPQAHIPEARRAPSARSRFRGPGGEAEDPGGLPEISRRTQRPAGLFLLFRRRLRPPLSRRGQDLSIHCLSGALLGGRPARGAGEEPGDGGAGPLRVRRRHGASRPSRDVGVGAIRARAPAPGELGDPAQGGWRAPDRHPVGLCAQPPRGHGGLVPVYARRHGAPGRVDRRQYPPSRHRARPVPGEPAPEGLGKLPHSHRQPLPVRRRNPSRGRGYGCAGAQCRRRHSAGLGGAGRRMPGLNRDPAAERRLYPRNGTVPGADGLYWERGPEETSAGPGIHAVFPP